MKTKTSYQTNSWTKLTHNFEQEYHLFLMSQKNETLTKLKFGGTNMYNSCI